MSVYTPTYTGHNANTTLQFFSSVKDPIRIQTKYDDHDGDCKVLLDEYPKITKSPPYRTVHSKTTLYSSCFVVDTSNAKKVKNTSGLDCSDFFLLVVVSFWFILLKMCCIYQLKHLQKRMWLYNYLVWYSYSYSYYFHLHVVR